MSLYAIGDMHLSLSTDKPMDVFQGKWENYVEKLRKGFSILKDEDVCVICGDITWAMNIDQAEADFKFIDSMPGKKIILKGNHDYWWSTANKAKNFFKEKRINTIQILHNNCEFYRDVAICGTRGWFYEEETHNSEHDRKIMNREIMRLETSLKAAGEHKKICFLHYPPRYKDYVCVEIIELMKKYDVQLCCYGHIHGKSQKYAVEGFVDGINYMLVSADYIDFCPIKIYN